jgi:hypothetical protein
MTVRQDLRDPDLGAPMLVPASGRQDPLTFLARRVMPFVLLGGVFVVLVRLASRPLHNFDTYFHLRFGHEFLDGSWSLRDPGSVSSFATADWVPTQWLPQMVMARTEEWFGLAGVAWLSGLQFVALAVTLYTVARRWADPIVASPLVVVALVASGSGMSMRPQVISYLLVAVTAAAWLRAHETRRTPWWLVPVTWVWAMCHGMWPVGIVIGVVAVVGMALDRRAGLAPLGRMAAVPILSLLTSFLTPVGPGLLSAVLLVNSRGQYFSEWAPPDFTSPQCLALLGLLAVTLLAMQRRNERYPWTWILMVLLALGWAVYSSRTVPVAAAVLVPLAAAALQESLGSPSRVVRGERAIVGVGVVGALTTLAFLVPSSAAAPPPQPAWVDPALSSLPSGTKVLDESAFGGYLMWRYPQLDLMAHGYGDTYTTGELERNSQIGDLKPGWDDLVRESNVEYALLDPESPLAYALRKQEGWTVLHDDPEVQLLQPPPGWMSED